MSITKKPSRHYTLGVHLRLLLLITDPAHLDMQPSEWFHWKCIWWTDPTADVHHFCVRRHLTGRAYQPWANKQEGFALHWTGPRCSLKQMDNYSRHSLHCEENDWVSAAKMPLYTTIIASNKRSSVYTTLNTLSVGQGTLYDPVPETILNC